MDSCQANVGGYGPPTSLLFSLLFSHSQNITEKGGEEDKEEDLEDEFEDLKKQLALMKAKREATKSQMEKAAHGREIALFTSYLEGLLCTDSLSADKLSRIMTAKKSRNITEKEYKEILFSLGESEETIASKRLKYNEKPTITLEKKRICTICYENEPNILFLPCMHCVICEECHDEYYSNDGTSDDDEEDSNTTCPICSQNIQDAKKVFW